MASEPNPQSNTPSYPITPNRLSQIAHDACNSTFHTTTTYDHSQTSSWNTSIIVRPPFPSPSPPSPSSSHTPPTPPTPHPPHLPTIPLIPLQNSILQSLISATSTPQSPPPYKYAVTSTIIQHTSSPAPRPPTVDDFPRPPSSTAGAIGAGNNDEERAVSDEKGVGKAGKAAVARRGMHSATGAFWDSQKDGMWSFKYEGGEEGRGFDVVVSVVWISI